MTVPATSELDLPDDELLRRIVNAVTAHPEVREPLLRVLLTDEFLNLPAEVKELREEMREGFSAVNERIDEVNRTVNERIDEVNERIDEVNRTVNERIDEVNERIDEVNRTVNERIDEVNRTVNERIDEVNRTVNERIDEVNERIGEVSRTVNERIDENSRLIGILTGQMGELRGEAYERRCAEQIDAVLFYHFDFAALADRTSINRQLIQARHEGLITREEYEGGRNVDIIAREQTEDGTPTRFAAVEVSVTFNEDDLRNAAGRAAVIARITGVSTTAFLVTRNTWPESVDAIATGLGVAIIRHS